jgi:hypothetical protein
MISKNRKKRKKKKDFFCAATRLDLNLNLCAMHFLLVLVLILAFTFPRTHALLCWVVLSKNAWFQSLLASESALAESDWLRVANNASMSVIETPNQIWRIVLPQPFSLASSLAPLLQDQFDTVSSTSTYVDFAFLCIFAAYLAVSCVRDVGVAVRLAREPRAFFKWAATSVVLGVEALSIGVLSVLFTFVADTAVGDRDHVAHWLLRNAALLAFLLRSIAWVLGSAVESLVALLHCCCRRQPAPAEANEKKTN